MSSKLRWAILGSAGMLGKEFMEAIPYAKGFDRSEFDITELESVRTILKDFDIVVNCAAWTAVDDAEEMEGPALEINGNGPRNVALTCKEISAHMVQISTDYVFPGDANFPYSEEDNTGPLSAYGRTKLAGEIAVKEVLPGAHYIVRTAWLYGEYGPNFVKTMQGLEKIKAEVKVVDDQFGQPTWARDLVQKIIQMVENDVPSGTYHCTSSGTTTWFEFARKIFELVGADINRVHPTSTSSFPRPAPRPAYSVLAMDKLSRAGIPPIQHWEKALTEAFHAGAFSDS